MTATRLDDVIARHAPQAVMHFAARSDVGESARDPAKYWRDNVAGSLTLIEAMLAGGVDRLVFSSTCAVYGDQDGVTLDEARETRPINAYAASKRAIEDMARDFGAAHGLRTVTFRYFNVAGADPEAEIGEAHDPETHLVPLMLQAVAGKRPALTVHGTDYETPDGTCIRDYVHVWDLVAAHVLGLERLLGGGGVAALQPRHGHRLFGARGGRCEPRRHQPRGAGGRRAAASGRRGAAGLGLDARGRGARLGAGAIDDAADDRRRMGLAQRTRLRRVRPASAQRDPAPSPRKRRPKGRLPLLWSLGAGTLAGLLYRRRSRPRPSKPAPSSRLVAGSGIGATSRPASA